MPGIAQKTFVIDSVPVLTTAIGPAAGDSSAGYAWNNGIFGVVPIGKKGWRISPKVRWTKSQHFDSAADHLYLLGLYGWGKLASPRHFLTCSKFQISKGDIKCPLNQYPHLCGC